MFFFLSFFYISSVVALKRFPLHAKKQPKSRGFKKNLDPLNNNALCFDG